MKEKVVEKYLREQVEAVRGTCEKFVSPGRRAVPDRLITWPYGDMMLVETKAPKGKLRASQKRDHRRRRKMGIQVHVVNTKAGVDFFMHCCAPYYADIPGVVRT